MNSRIRIFSFLFAVLTCLPLISQEKEPSPFDFGRMWTFENPPKEWFKEAYDFTPEDSWYADVRTSSLRFASWCSASFVSPNGLIMTNHHCSRDEGIKAQNDGENFDKFGFYATNLEDERRIDELYVEQMIMAVDITDQVMMKTKNAENDADKIAKVQAALTEIEEAYKAKSDWAGLRTQVVEFYSGGKYSIYGYKRYDDIRLVCMPENSIGFYGGDPDNFTYPRYNLDFTFWRAYDENGQPLNTSENYLPFNKDGAEEGEVVFVVGNPGRTERYRTVAQLEYDRDYRFKMLLRFLQNRNSRNKAKYAEIKDDPSMEREAQELLGTITNFENSIKAYTGIQGGLHDPALFGRKVGMEKIIKDQSPGVTYWDDLEKSYANLKPKAWAITHLGPSPLRGNVLMLLHEVYKYDQMLGSDEATDEDVTATKEAITNLAVSLNDPDEAELWTLLLEEIKADIPTGNMTLKSLLGTRSIQGYVNDFMSNTSLKSSDGVAKMLKSKKKKWFKKQDPVLVAARALVPEFNDAVAAFRSSGAYRSGLETKIANQAFEVYGSSLPPDATFTLRISDGVVKGYDYNGTTAPPITTFFGMYDRFYSHGQEYPWDLPERWQDPSMDLLKSPLNIVSTNDIIGGNSGSPMINAKGEAIGLIFDGNIESLPGNFIFDDEYNRTVSVHAGGIYACLKYIVKADRIVNELTGEE